MSRRFSIEVAKDYFNFASAHFLIFANGRREPLRGHNYQVSVAMEGELDRAGVVLDFITFKPLVKQVCDVLDHRTLIQTSSSAIQVRQKGPARLCRNQIGMTRAKSQRAPRKNEPLLSVLGVLAR